MIDTNLEKALEVIKQARSEGIVFFLENEKIKFKVPKGGEVSASLLAEIKVLKEEIRAILSTQHLHNGNAQTPSAITAADRGDMSLIPLSYSQERLWFLDQLESSANYHIPAILRLKGSLHHEALAYALRTIVNRHEVLRTIIEEEDGKAHQRVLEKDLWELDIITHGHEEEAVALQSFVKSLIDIPFDLGNDHMLRAHLTRKDEEEHLLVVVMHHIASDGWSVGIIVKELIALYEAYGEGRTADLSTMDIQYADYAIWQRRHISGAVIDKQLDYWKHKLNDVQPLQLPTDYPRPAIQSTRGAQVLFHFDKQLAAKLNRLSRSHDVTLYMTLLAAFNVLLHRYTGQDDICVGSPVAGRTMQEVEDLVGFFINTLALRNNLAGNPSFTAVLQQVRQTMLGAYDHQDVPFEKIVEAVTKERDMSRSPLFQVVFVLQNTPDAPELQLGGLQLTHEQALHTTAKFDLSFVIHEDETGLSGKVEYCAELFKEDTVTRMVAHFQQLLQSLAANPGENIGSLAMLSGEEQQLLTTGFNNRVANYPADKTAVALFEEKAAAIPDAPALLFADGQLTYSQLDEYANRIAQLLQQNGVLPETLVPLCIERSPLTIAAILGILKAGGAYVPIDPDYPAERISYVLEDTQASLVLSSKASMGKIPAKDGLRVIALDDDTAATDSYAAVKPEVTLNAGNLAYIIYTSGSTGKPKGVMIAHRGLVNLALGQAELLRLKEGMRYLQFASFGFDASCYEIFNTLLSGGALVLPSKEELLTAERFGEMVSRYNVEVVTLPPSYQHMIKEVLGPVKTVVSAGEPLIREDARYMQSAGIRLINAYGPTENTVCTTLTDNPLRDNGVVSIGDPVPNVQVYILDAYKGLSPMGVAGEICVGGANLARGYLHREALTNEKFISNPFSNDAESRLYRTGDLGRWLPDGTIEYLGRIDDQVKIRGYRIEPGEIESVLQQCTLVDEAVVIAKADQQQHHHKRLIGYVVPVGPFDREGITAWLRQQLPEYMVPAMIIPLDKLPVTPSGKVDRKALPEPDVQALTKAAYNAPRNAAEQAIAAIWQELLGLQRVGIHDNFFELGGDSIITIQVVSRAKQQGYVLHPRDLFTHQTISELSPLLTTAKTAAIFGEQGMLTGVSGLLPIQQWFFETGGSGNAHFNQSVLLSIGKSVEASVLDAAIKQLVRYHDALRFTYRPDSKGFIQEYGDYEPRLETVDLRNIPAEDLTARIEAYASDCHQGPDTGKGTLFHAALLQMPSDETHNRLLFIIHHLAVDGVSWRILLQDLETLLKKKGNRKAAAVLGLKGSSFRQWYDALASYGHRPQLLHQQEYWEKTVQRYVPLKTDKKSDSIVTAADTAHIVVKLPAAQTQRLLQEAPRAYHTEINDLLLAALAKTIAGWTQTADVLIGLEGHGREDISAGIDISRTVGWFTNLYPVLLEVKPGKDNGSFLKDIKEQLRKIKDKGVGYGVLKYINRTSALQGKDPWDVIFNYLGQTDNVIREDGILTSAPESSGSGLGAAFPVREKLSVNSIIQDEELVLQWGYSTLHYEAESISTLAAAFVSNLELLIAHCTEQAANGTVYTPADYNLGDEVSNEELDAFLDTPFAGAPRRAQVESLYRLSSLQEGMLFHNLINEQAAVYVEPMSCQLRNLDEDIFLQSWNELTRRHSILRTAFYHQVFSIPVQCVYNQVRIPFNVIDLRHLDETARGQAIQEYEAADGKTAFDLAAAPLMRITLFRLQGNDYRMLWTSHHIILDGWSLAVMVKELLEIYESLATGGPLSFVTVDQFEDYIRYLERRDKEQDEYYWRNYLHTLTAGNLLPFISSTAERTRGTGIYREKLLRINAAATGRLAQYAQRSHITLNTLMQGVWSYLLYRYTGSNEVVYGITVSGRPDDLSGIEQRVGLYINTIPSHTVLEPEAGITEWLRQLQNGQMQSREYQYVGLNEIQRWTGLQGELFDTSITFQNYPINEVVASHSWKLQIDDVEAHPHTNYPLTIIIGIAEEASLLFTYNSDLLPTFYIEQIAAHFEETLEQMITHEDGKIADIDLLTPAGLSELAGRGAHRIAVTVPEKPFTHLFESQVRHTPQAVALAFEDHILTYQELDERSSQLANYLRSKGVGADTLVPLCIERSAAMIIAILGIVKAGGAYVPIEPDFPAERIKFMLEDTRASVIVSSNTAREALPDISGLDIIAIEDGKIDSCSTIVRELPFTADRLLYVIYTSGSTGTPKGVLVTHGNLYDYIAGLSAALPVNACRSFGLLSSIATDLGNTVLFSALLSGAVLHLFSKAAINDAGYMYDYMDKYPVDCIKIVPSHWKALSEPEKLLLPAKLLIFGGEALESAVVESIWMSGSRCTVVNHYGPTETTIGKLLHVVNTDSLYDDVVPVGKPFSNTDIYVVSKDGKLCPTGVPGELYIGGAGVASGYLNNKELTASKFINNIFSADHPTKLYRTGDLVKYLPDGNILFLGRVDDQVKIRGYRVEPGEISRILSQCELVNQGVVIARADNSGNKRLLAYVIPEGDFEKEAILDFLRSRLPEYMIPAVVIPLQQFPLMANGKIDRKALPEPEAAVTTQTGGEPETELEKTLAAIWASLLEVDQVQLQDDFFALGGHSLLAIRVISAIRKQLGVVVSIGDLFDYPTVGALAAQIAARSAPSPVESNLVRRERPAHIPLSYSQERLWFIDQLEGSVHYHIPTVIRLRGNLDKVALENAFRTIVNRHEALRTVVVTDNGDAGQRILDKDGWQLQVTDDPALKQDTVALQAYIQQLLEAPFDLTASYMLRAHLVVLGATEYILVAVVHHIASDAWSKSIIVKELAALYNAATVELPVPEMQYADYALWQRGYLDGAVLEEKISYWKNKLTGVAALNLPTDFPRPVVQSTRGAVVAFNIDKTTTDGLNTLSREEGVTLFMTLLAAYNVLLYRYSGGTDICIGTSIAGRTRQELEGIVGFFINTLALRTDLSNDPAFTALLQQVKQTTLEAFGHQDVPFEKVVEAVVKQRDVSRTPLFQAAFSLQSGPVAPDLALNGLVLENESVTYTTTKFDLVFTIQETPEGLHGLIEYGADLFREDTIHRMAAHYGQLLRAVVQSRKQKVNALTMLTPDEMEQLLTTFNDTAVPFPQQHSILDLFALQVITQPDATALIYNDEIRTYKELDDRSNQLAHFLQHRGVTKETLVPLCMHRSFEMLTAIFAVLKAGGAYVPVDPDYPEQRISYMLADTGATLLLSASSCEDRLPVMSGIDIILLDNEQDNINAYAKTPLQEQPSPDQLAYVIYTSGSTGRPKGVMIEHQGVVNMALGQAAALRLQRGTRSLQFASFGFDASCYEIFNTLLSGGILVLPQQDDLLITARFAALLEKHAVELVTLPPSYQHVVKEQLASVKTVVSAGEPLNREDGQYIRSKGIRLINAYGPTENTVCTTLTDQPFHDNNTIVIGSPVANMQVYILGDGHALCPVGVPGEICTSGAGLARGYLHRPDLTAEKFIRHPYSNAWGSRLYRTGDLGRWLPDGTIEYLGRIDDQVKIRGYRIELGEIERVLQDSDLVKQAVVLAKTDAHDAALKRLVAYVVPDGDFNRTGIISHLQKILPEYMIPAAFVAMEQLPLTPSGKFDRKALPDPEVAAESEYTAPRTATEQLLAGIWEQLLNRERIGIYDNFFEAGGHSLLAMRFMAALRRQLGVELSMKALFLHPTIAGFAAYMQENKVSALPPVVTGERPEMIPLSYSQERLWFIDQLEGSVHYHIPAVLRLKGAIDILSLEKALTAIVGRHEVLRTVFEEYEGEVYQHVQEKGSWQLEVIAVHAVEVDEMITSLINRPFDLAIDHMLRAQLLLLTNNEHLLVVTLHHIAADGWSMGIIVKELAALYQAAIAGNEDPLPVPEIQFADYAVWERTHLSGAVLEEKVAYWRNKLAGTTVLNIPADLPRPAIQSTRGAISLFRFEATLLQQLRYLSQQEGTTLFMTLLAAFKVLLYRYTGQEDVCIGTTIAGRTRQETESLIGFFVNTLALRSDLAGEPSFTALLQQVKETTLNAYDHQEVPFEKVVEEVVKDRDVSRTPLFQVMFELQNTPDTPELELGGLELKQEETGATTAKFDLDFALQESIEGLHLTVSYCTDLFNAETISRMTNHFHQLLESIVGNPAQLISRLKMVTPAEEEELLYLFNNKSVAWPQQETLVSLLTTQAAATPDAIAVKAGSIQLTYGELDAYAGRLAQLLRNNGITTGSMVPICMERSPFMVIAMLGVMKAGAAYVPVDPEYPQERMLFMLDDCAATIAVGTHYGSTKLAAAKNIQVINLEELPESITADNPLLSPDPAHLAYIIYTSGSTGKPKGVMVEHAGMLNHLYAKINDLQLDQHSVIAFTAAYTFDISVWQVFAALLCGGTTVIYDEETILNPAALTEAVDKDRITILELVPSYLAAVLQENITVAWQPLRYLLVTGEAVSWHLLSQWFAHPQFGRVPVVNAYGPTEASDDICHHIMYNLPAYTNIPLGAPVQNLHIYIINKEGQLCPVNVPGEICVSGVGVSRGYLNRPDLTARQFVTDPFVPARGRMYKTGDLGRWLPDGTVEYLGRIDEQVKIRGYRIELGEIESVMLQSGYVKEAVVVAHEDANHNKRLIGYIVPVSSFDKSIILNWLKDKLPEYMIPSLLVELEKVPLTPNGKTDRKALPDPGESLSQLQEYVAPRNETEETLVKIWSGLLGIERIGVTDNFFELGGHSLQVMRLIAMIRKQLQATISVRDFFTLATIESLAKYIRVNQTAPVIPDDDLQTIKL